MRRSRKNRNGIEAERLAVYIGAGIAYKHGDRPRGQSLVRRKTMATKKATKKLRKAKKLQPTKPLTRFDNPLAPVEKFHA